MLNQIFISDSFAQATQATQAGAQEFSFASFVPLMLIFGVFYFLILRPQSKKYKDHQKMVDSLKKGVKVVTTGGIVGEITKVNSSDNSLEIEISEGVLVTILRNYVADVVDSKKDKKSSLSKKTTKTATSKKKTPNKSK